MEATKAIEILERHKAKIENLKTIKRNSPDFIKWKKDTETALERIFGSESKNYTYFINIKYNLPFYVSGMPDSDFQDAYIQGLEKAAALLSSMIDEIKEYDLENNETELAPDSLTLVERICLRFHSVARQLRSRHSSRETIEIEDEYDVQDLLHALLKIHFDDIRPEEWTPSYAGGSSRVDFLLKNEQIIIEVKKTRASMSTNELGGQLLIDRARYEEHPDCKILVCFVYDPEGRIGNPAGIERDLEKHSGQLKVRAIIGPKG